MSDLYESALGKYRGSPSMIILFVLALAMFVLGANHFIEDTYSSKYGLENLEQVYRLNIQIFDWTYWTMSLAPQVASMVFAYLYLSDTRKKWALGVSLSSQFMDFFADSWYRSNGQLFDSSGILIVSALLTFVYFSIGSEFFLTVGGGLIIKLFAPALHTWRVAVKNVKDAAKAEYRPPQKQARETVVSNKFFDQHRIKKNGSGEQGMPFSRPRPEPSYHPRMNGDDE
jgi:hypothetical protein